MATLIEVQIYNFGHDVNGNKIGKFLVRRNGISPVWETLYSTSHRRQVGYDNAYKEAVLQIMKEAKINKVKWLHAVTQPDSDWRKTTIIHTFEEEEEPADLTQSQFQLIADKYQLSTSVVEGIIETYKWLVKP